MNIGRLDFGRCSAQGLARLGVLMYLIAVPFTHNAAWKNGATLLMLGAAIGLWQKRQLVIKGIMPLATSLMALLAILLLSAFAGVDPLSSLNELRKHFLPGLLLFLLTAVAFREEEWQRRLLLLVGFAFLARIGLAVIELFAYGDLAAARDQGRFVKGLALDAGFYFPVYIGLMVWRSPYRWFGTIAAAAVFGIIVAVQGRAPLLAALVSALAMLAVLRKWRVLVFLFGGAIVALGVLMVTQPVVGERFAAAFSPKTYLQALDRRAYGSESDGLSGRIPIWLGVIEIGNARPLLGYGFGWKKLGKIAVEDGYLARWEAMRNDAVAKAQVSYFSLPTDKVNPHNLYLQIYFEAGIVGVAAYLVVLGISLWQSWHLARGGPAWEAVVGAIIFGFLVNHIVLGFANGLWLGLGPSMAWLGLLAALPRRMRV
jgi:O-antigen ligase